ncbi:MAG: AAA family ATPase [Candidatus Diapherotrites archaeon]
MLVLIAGLQATGKTFISKKLAPILNAEHLSTDIIRRELLSERTYSEEEKAKVYDALFEKTSELLFQKKPVIIDGTFYKKELRDRALATAQKNNSSFHKIVCTASDDIIKTRINLCERKETKTEADFSVYEKTKAMFEKFEGDFLELNTALSNNEQLNTLRDYIFSNEIVFQLSKRFEYIQTHISNVFLTGKFVYKIKKPVKFTFLDYSTLEKRKKFCQLELELNKRLCPDLYLAVVPVSFENSEITFSDSNPVEYAVKMRQLPADKKMDILLENNEVTEQNLMSIAETLSDFHNNAETITKNFSSPEQIKSAINDLANFRDAIENELSLGSVVDSVLENCNSFIDGNSELFEERISDGRIKRCHGDVYSKNIFIDDKIYIFDAIEFNEEFARIDVASEIAFLAMDLDFHKKEEFSNIFIEKYIELSNDSEISKIMNLYKCYRANVRAKVSAISFGFASGAEKEKLLVDCKNYLQLCERYAEKW